MTEKQWQAIVLELAAYGGWAHFHPFDSRRSVAGWPDLVLCRPPELLIIELKSDTGRVKKDQMAWLQRLAACGVEVGVWRPRDFDAVQARLLRRH